MKRIKKVLTNYNLTFEQNTLYSKKHPKTMTTANKED
jgi:hypothetical protein